ncbi:MAG: hypothetical protein C4K47_07250 [Candidatus Thorarchaeota archaeon]|nr:MAG: hypothetical protein C4K47_07250 [Candidatus Thorarchaeota archaeon]
MEVKSIYIVKRETGVCMYNHDFEDPPQFDPHLISSFIVAMTSFFDEATRSVTSQARAFEGADYEILVEFGTWTLGALSVTRDTAHLREKLRRTITRFEEQFNVLRWVDLDLAVHTRFDHYVLDEFLKDSVKPDSTIQVKRDWQFYTRDAEVVALLRLIPAVCTVKEAADFLEVPIDVALNWVAEATWEKAVTITNPVKPDDIYQTTALVGAKARVKGISAETTKALSELDGETPLAIAAEKVKTSDLKRFLDDIALLARYRAVERVSPSQAVFVLHLTALKTMMNRYAKLLGFRTAYRIFSESRNPLLDAHPWLAFVDFEETLDLDVKSSLTTAFVRGSITPETITDGFRPLFQSVVREARGFLGAKPVNTVLTRTRQDLEKEFPSRAYEIPWELMTQ